MSTSSRTEQIETAREIDTRIAAAWELYWAVVAPAATARKELSQANKMTSYYSSRPTMAAHFADKVDFLTAKIEKLLAEGSVLAAAAQELDAAEYKGWKRFFLVEHIHSSRFCSSFRATTKIGWLPKVSGLTEAEAVAEYGSILCTICFPTAPVEWTQAAQDPTTCSGAGESILNGLPSRKGYYSGNYATCATCNTRVGVTKSAQRIPKHKQASL